VSGIVKGFVSKIVAGSLTKRREYLSYNKIQHINIDAKDETHHFFSRTEAVLSISTKEFDSPRPQSKGSLQQDPPPSNQLPSGVAHAFVFLGVCWRQMDDSPSFDEGVRVNVLSFLIRSTL
jgi:hypothetical protein